MAKEKRPTGRKIKQSQPIALAREFRDTLEEFQVIKGPVVPKFEVVDKYVVGRGWKLSLRDGHGTDAGAFASVGIPGLDGPVVYEATGETAMHAATYALCEALKMQPRQSSFSDREPPDPDGKDLPMFSGNGGVAGPIGVVNLSDVARQAVADVKEQIRSGSVDGLSLAEDGTVRGSAEAPNPWTFLFVVSPADLKAWRAGPPLHDGAAIVDWEEGDDLNDRGWYLDPGFHYDPKVGEIRLLAPDGETGELVWSRDVAPKKSRAGAAPKVSNTTPTQAEALHLAGAQR